jgi:hypothetical protein
VASLPAINAAMIAYDLTVMDNGLLTINADSAGGAAANNSAVTKNGSLLSGDQQATFMLAGISPAVAPSPAPRTIPPSSNRTLGSALAIGRPDYIPNPGHTAIRLSGAGSGSHRSSDAPAGLDPFGEGEVG